MDSAAAFEERFSVFCMELGPPAAAWAFAPLQTAKRKRRENDGFSWRLDIFELKSALAELQGLGADPAKHPVISSLST